MSKKLDRRGEALKEGAQHMVGGGSYREMWPGSGVLVMRKLRGFEEK